MTTQQDLSPEDLARLEKENEEAKKKFAGLSRTLTSDLKAMKDTFAASLALAKEQHAQTASDLKETQAVLADLKKEGNKPEAQYAGVLLGYLSKNQQALMAMMEAQMRLDSRNLELADKIAEAQRMGNEDPLVWVRLEEQGALDSKEMEFADPEDDLEFLEARANMHCAMGLFSWMNCLNAIDLIMRAALNEPAILSQSDEEEEVRKQLAVALRNELKANPELMRMVGQLGTELQDAAALLEWGSENLKRLASVPAASKRQILKDADWAKLTAKANLLAELPTRVQKYPDLAILFPEPNA